MCFPAAFACPPRCPSKADLPALLPLAGAFGRAASCPAVVLDSAALSVAGVLIFIATLAASRWLSRRECSRQGDTALFFMALLGASQILLESLRDDGHMLVIFLRVGQLAAALMTVIACAVLSVRYARLGRGSARLWLGWAVMFLCMAGVVLLEVSLDGRLSWGEPSMGRDYALMAVLCAGMFAVPALLMRAVCGGARACRTSGEARA